jgi:hypothetical protein
MARRSTKGKRWKFVVRSVVSLACVPLLIGFMANASAARRKPLSVELLATQSVIPGETAHFPFVVRASGRLGTVKLEAEGVPAKVRARFLSGGKGLYELSLDVASDAKPSLSTVTIRVRSQK